MALTTSFLCCLFAISLCSLLMQGKSKKEVHSYSPIFSNASVNANANGTATVNDTHKQDFMDAILVVIIAVLLFWISFFFGFLFQLLWKHLWSLVRQDSQSCFLKLAQRIPVLRAKAKFELEKRNLESINYLKFQPYRLLNFQTLSFRCHNQSVHLNLFTGNITDGDNKSLAVFRRVRGGFVSIRRISTFFTDFSCNPEIFTNNVPSYIDCIQYSLPQLNLEPHRCWPLGHADTLLWLNDAYKFLMTEHFQNDAANLIFSAMLLNYKAWTGTPKVTHSFVLKCSESADGENVLHIEVLPLIAETVGILSTAECCIYSKILDLRTQVHPDIRIEIVSPLLAAQRNQASNCMEYLDMDLDRQKILESIRVARALLCQKLHLENVSKLQWHFEGAQVQRPCLAFCATYIYIFLVTAFATVVVNLNLNNRRSVAERFFDGFTVLSIGLVLVFGLLKLKSEDPNYMRNQLTGLKVFKSTRAVCSYLRISEAMLKCLLEVKGDTCRWVSDKNAGALDIPCTGELRFERGCSAIEVMAMGKLLLYNIRNGKLRLYDAVKDRYRTAKWNGVDRAVIESREFTNGGEPGLHDIVVRGPVIIE